MVTDLSSTGKQLWQRTKKLKLGLVQVYTGPGKGKTTAALGLAFRAIGHGFKVCMIQFMKGNSYCGELLASQRLKPDLDFYQFGRDCPYASLIRGGFKDCDGCGENCFDNELNHGENGKLACMAFAFAGEVVTAGEHDLVILDEINNALAMELISSVQVLELIGQKPPLVELVLTGRDLPLEILAAADLVSRIDEVKHPYSRGIKGRRGIEY